MTRALTPEEIAANPGVPCDISPERLRIAKLEAALREIKAGMAPVGEPGSQVGYSDRGARWSASIATRALEPNP